MTGEAQGLRLAVKRVAGMVPRLATTFDYARFRFSHRQRWPPEHSSVLREIREHGYVMVPGYFDADQCNRCIADFERLIVDEPGHVQRASDVRVFGIEDLSPIIRRFADDPYLLALARAYNGTATVNAFTLANRVDAVRGSRGSGEGWHKDSSFRQFKAFVYLNDVNADNGPFQLIHASHALSDYLHDMRIGGLSFRHLRISDDQVNRIVGDTNRLKTLTGARGTLLLVDTAAIHRGCPPIRGTRYALTNYYVEPKQITREFVDAYKPVLPDKVWGLRRMQEGR